MNAESVDVLVVGAGPTGLTLAAQLASHGVGVRVVDAKAGPVAESRALAIQPRTLEVLPAPVADKLLELGNRAVRLQWHAGGRTASLPLFDLGLDDTAFPFLLFLSQAETETVLVEHLADLGVAVEWKTRFTGSAPEPSGHADAGTLVCRLIGADGRERQVTASYLVGCDGAHSAVREASGIAFTGGRYPQTFLLADTDAEGVEPGAAHVWLGQSGPLFFFPLVRPAAWRVLTGRPAKTNDGSATTAPDVVEELQAVIDATTGGAVRLAPPVWSTAFQIHHRHAESYRRGPVFLAGDAAHIHSPAGAQGMNTGIQDAVNLGWKLALVAQGRADPRLLDSYETERRPVGTFVLRFTDRAFTVATANTPALRFARTHVAPRALTLAARARRLRAVAFRIVAQLSIRYPPLPPSTADPSGSATASESPKGGGPLPRAVGSSPWAQRLRLPAPRPRPGERLPDAEIVVDSGQREWLHRALSGNAFQLLLCGRADAWDREELDRLTARHPGLVRVVHLARSRIQGGGGLADPDGEALRRLGVRGLGHLLVRPDGHVACRGDGTDLADVESWLAGWFPEHRHLPSGPGLHR